MQGHGESSCSRRCDFLLTPARTREVLVQWSKADQILVLPFSDHVLWTATASGDEAEQAASARQDRSTLRADGGTDFYTCGARRSPLMKPLLDAGAICRRSSS